MAVCKGIGAMSPTKPLKPCGAPGCAKLTDGAYCEEHTKAQQRLEDKRRGSSSERGYDVRWQRLRAWYLKQYPLCNRCEGVVPATVVHHIKPISEGGARLDVENLEALCATCHNKHHGFGK